MKKVVVAVVLAIIGWAVWPYYALYDLGSGLERANQIILEQRIAWDSVRHGLRDDINAMLMAMLATDPSIKPPGVDNAVGNGLSAVFGPAIINQLVDAYVSPQTLPNLIRNGSLNDIAAAQNIPEVKEPYRIFSWRNVQYAFFSGGPFAFVVEISTNSKLSKQPLTLLFKWSGDWKLTRIFLPSDAIAKLAFDRAKQANTVEAWDGFLNYFRNDLLSKEARDERQKLVEKAKEMEALASSNGVQQAILYEEDAQNPQGKHFVGTTRWRTEMVSPGLSQELDMAARADAEVPERGIKMTWTFRRNADKSLPASHTIEIRFDLTQGFPQTAVDNVPGVLAKQREKERGVPLAGLAVKVSTGYFLVGLSQVRIDLQRNVQLLKNDSWFDIPIVYSNGRRAILAIEKGNSGDTVFAKVFSYWDTNFPKYKQ